MRIFLKTNILLSCFCPYQNVSLEFSFYRNTIDVQTMATMTIQICCSRPLRKLVHPNKCVEISYQSQRNSQNSQKTLSVHPHLVVNELPWVLTSMIRTVRCEKNFCLGVDMHRTTLKIMFLALQIGNSS